jgi:hypothetical protein
MHVNIKHIGLTIGVVLFGLFALASTAFALPPKPAMPGGPAAPSQPQVPAQPQLPPCVECNEVFGSPTPTPVPSTTPTPSVGGSSSGGSSSGGGGSTSSSSSSAPAVLGLSATSGGTDLSGILSVIGMAWVGLGLRIRNRK